MEQDVQHSARGVAAIGRAIAIKRVFSYVEVEGRKIDRGEFEHGPEDTLEIVSVIAGTHFVIQFRDPVQDPAFQFRHVCRVNAFGFGKPVQAAKDEPHGVAQAAIGVRCPLQDFGADALITGIVGLRDPEAQDVGTVLADNLVRDDGVAQGFGHLVAFLVQGETVGQDTAIGRAAIGAAGLQKRRVKPTAVLVGAFQIEVRDPVFAAVLAVAQNEGVGRT